MGTQNEEIKNTEVVSLTSQGVKIQAIVKRLTRHAAVLEVYNPPLDLCVSEVFAEFKLVILNHTAYLGRAVVRSLVDTGSAMICEVALDENSWRPSGKTGREELHGEFREFLNQWQKFYRVSEDYKVVVADIQTFLTDLQAWLERVQLGIVAATDEERTRIENEIAHNLKDPVCSSLSNLFERFELIADKIETDLQPVHRAFGQRQLHPFLLCCPFMNRIFTKPLGYAGDYEMMNMIVRNAPEGGSLFAKLLQLYILHQAPALAVRNRVDYFVQHFVTETGRVFATGRKANLCSIGCGPAREVEDFMAQQPLSDQAQFRLMDFNDETLRHTGGRLEAAKLRYQRKTTIQLVKKQVQFLLKERGNLSLGEEKYDVIYCSGLYDYLNDRVIQALNTRLYDRLHPGGMLIVTNFDPYNPIRHIMEFIFDWFLIHRDGKQLAALAPDQARQEQCEVRAEMSGCNIFLEIRKPC